MPSSLYANLDWLLRAPEYYSKQVAQLSHSDQPSRELRRLASYALDENKLIKLANVIRSLQSEGRSLAPLVPFRLGIIGNGTLDFVVPALIASCARHGILLDCIKGEYNQIIQEAVTPNSIVNRAAPDAVLVAMDYRAVPLLAVPGDVESARANVAKTMDYIGAIRSGIHSSGRAIAILQTVAPPPEVLFGSFDRTLDGTLRSMIDTLNRDLAASINGTQDLLLDVAGLAETVGLADWHSPAQWNLAKIPFNNAYLPIYAEYVARIIAASRGKSRRCLILDLDNTIWGGVIGDDGVEGLNLGQGDPTGEAHLAVQRLALSLRERGVVLAVCSKNDDKIAREPFRRHPEMLLRENHIAAFQANWNDKASNIYAIADELSLGLDSLVFLDDNPMERALVRQMLPEVAVPELPDDPALYSRFLNAAGYFEFVAFSTEDRQRASFYEDNARRIALQNKVNNLDDFLASLKMTIMFQPFDAIGRTRITQLINKSNQFNLTTRRYVEAEVQDIEADPRCFTLQVRLTDTFGDNGMISVVICRAQSVDTWEIDTWLMSCRVLGRQAENMILAEILRHALAAGVTRLVGKYIPTERNSIVKDHYEKLGFNRIATSLESGSEWHLATDTVIVKPPMAVQRRGFRKESQMGGVDFA